MNGNRHLNGAIGSSNDPWTGHENGIAPTSRANYDSDSEPEDSDTSIISLTPTVKRPTPPPSSEPQPTKKRRYSRYQVDEGTQEAEFDRMANLLGMTF
jgi:hypothetical protein